MVNQQLLDYIKQQSQRGISGEEIKNNLIINGWPEQDVDEAFYVVSNSPSQSRQIPTPQQTISSLPGAIALLGQAWSIYKKRLSTFLGVMVIPLIMAPFIAAIFIWTGFQGITFLYSDSSSQNLGANIGLPILFIILLFAVTPIIQSLWQTALLYAIKDSQESIGIMESYRRGWRKILSCWWIFLLIIFITVGGFLLMGIPVIIFAVWFSFAFFVLITEDLKGMNALLKSKEYVRGKWWAVFWRLSFIISFLLIFSSIPGIIFDFLKIPFIIKNEEIIKRIIDFIIILFLTPIVTTYLFLLYNNLKSLKGEFVFAPTVGKKAVFTFIVLLGILMSIFILFLIFNLYLIMDE